MLRQKKEYKNPALQQPIDPEEHWPFDQLGIANARAERMVLLFEEFNIDRHDEDAWKKLAWALALRHEEAFNLPSGRPRKADTVGRYIVLLDRWMACKRAAKSAQAATDSAIFQRLIKKGFYEQGTDLKDTLFRARAHPAGKDHLSRLEKPEAWILSEAELAFLERVEGLSGDALKAFASVENTTAGQIVHIRDSILRKRERINLADQLAR